MIQRSLNVKKGEKYWFTKKEWSNPGIYFDRRFWYVTSFMVDPLLNAKKNSQTIQYNTRLFYKDLDHHLHQKRSSPFNLINLWKTKFKFSLGTSVCGILRCFQAQPEDCRFSHTVLVVSKEVCETANEKWLNLQTNEHLANFY